MALFQTEPSRAAGRCKAILIAVAIYYHDQMNLPTQNYPSPATNEARSQRPGRFLIALLFSLTVSFLSLDSRAQDPEREQSFDDWVAELRAEARQLGIREDTLLALDSLEAPLEKVLEYDNSQPEFVQAFTR